MPVRLRWAHISRGQEPFHLARNAPPQWVTPALHDHDFAELFLVTAGTGLHLVNGRRLLLQAHDLALLRATDTHTLRPLPGPSHDFAIMNLAFPAETVTFLADRYFAESAEFWGGVSAKPAIHHLGAGQGERWRAALAALGDGPRTRLALERFLLDLLAEVYASAAAGALTGCPEWLQAAWRQFRTPELFREGTRGLARLCCRTPEHVARVCRRATGRSPGDWVNDARLEYAAARLAGSGDGIQAVALACGFRSLSHFYALFKARFGVSPRHYRLRRTGVFRPPA